ncbi:SDR family NAD(P)-dependent oxidoreductase [Williamsia sp. CHRR-6]|nr:SDR family NAD(P)-dependent oxidoreductase [Williamsia sp. CHRR-6]
MSLDSATVFITGGAAGIGACTVRRLLAAGANVAVFDLTDAAAELGAHERLLALTGDVRDQAAVSAAVAATIARFGAVTVAIANAGITPPPGTIRQVDRALFDRVIDVNLHGVVNVIRATSDEIVRTGGHMSLICSGAAFTPGMGGAAYMISKAAVEQLGRALSIELSAVGASAGLVYFGVVDTGLAHATLDQDPLGRRMGERLPWPLSRRLSAEAAAAIVVRSVQRRSVRAIGGKSWYGYYWLRGLINPILEAQLIRDRSVHQLIRDLEARVP